MSNLDQFTIFELKKIIYATGLSKKIKMSVNKQALIKEMDKYIFFNGYDFHIFDNNEDKFIDANLLKKPPSSSKGTTTKKNKRPDLSLTDIQDINKKTVEINDYIKNKIEELKLLNKSFKQQEKEQEPKKYNKKLDIIKKEIFEL
jgi:hypothetical protein